MQDFNNDDLLSENESIGAEDGFFDVPNAPHEDYDEPEKKLQPIQSSSFKKEKKDNKIKIDISDIETLITNLSYTAKELEQSTDKLLEKKDLIEILQILREIKSNDLEKLRDTFKQIDIKHIENKLIENIKTLTDKVDDTFSLNLGKIEKETKKVTDKYKDYAKAFSDVDSIEAFENIQKIENFTKNFNKKFTFKSAILAASITTIITFMITFSMMDRYNKLKLKTEIKKYSAVSQLMYDTKAQMYQDGNIKQIIFNSDTKIQYFETKNGLKVIEFQK